MATEKNTVETTEATERVNPLRITDNEVGKTYELDFSRESIKFAEARGFDIDELTKFPVTRMPEFFYYAFRKNHKDVARANTDALFDKMGGLTGAIVERLGQLYAQAGLSHVISDDEKLAKNERVTVEL